MHTQYTPALADSICDIRSRKFKNSNSQLEGQAIIIKQELQLDVSIIDTPFKPKEKPSFRVAENREEDKNQQTRHHRVQRS